MEMTKMIDTRIFIYGYSKKTYIQLNFMDNNINEKYVLTDDKKVKIALVQIIKRLAKLNVTNIIIYIELERFSKFLIRVLKVYNIKYESETSDMRISSYDNVIISNGYVTTSNSVLLEITGYIKRYTINNSLEEAIEQLKICVQKAKNEIILIGLDETCKVKKDEVIKILDNIDGIKHYFLNTRENDEQILTDDVIDKNLMIKTILKTL